MANLQVEFKGNNIVKIWSQCYVFDCFIVPKSKITSSIEDFDNYHAVYFLVDGSESSKEKRHLYFGKTTNGMTRFFNHKASEKVWDRVFVFTAHDKYFTEDVILVLKIYLLKSIKRAIFI